MNLLPHRIAVKYGNVLEQCLASVNASFIIIIVTVITVVLRSSL